MELNLPLVENCSAKECSFNEESVCHAAAVTIGNSNNANCDTFVNLEIKGGIEGGQAMVGACKENDCKWNENLECTSKDGVQIEISGNVASCMTFST